MSVITDLLAAVQAVPDCAVKEVRVGLYWTGVYGAQLGIAGTQAHATCCFTDEVNGVGTLHECSVHALAERLVGAHPLEASVGMAALNALIPFDAKAAQAGNARDILFEKARGKKTVLIGHFPFSDALRAIAAQTWVLELEPTAGDVPAERAPDLLPAAEVIGLTASTLMNGTFEPLCKYFPPDAFVVMLGPSTPLSPVLFDYGVHVLGSAVAEDPAAVLHAIEQGGALHKGTGLRRVTLLR